MSKIIELTKEMICKQVASGKIEFIGKPFEKVQKFYYATNENIRGYMNLYNMHNKKIATVMGSCDHPLNACFHGATTIDTFDTNFLTKYYGLGIKISAILKYNYHEYLDFLKKIVSDNISPKQLQNIITSLLPYMESEEKQFWKEISQYNTFIQSHSQRPLNLFKMLSVNIISIDELTKKNSYLLNEANYNKLKRLLSHTKINFTNCDCLDLPTQLKKQYDMIFLSNIPDYFYNNPEFGYFWKYKKLQEVEHQFDKILRPNGLLFLDYMYLYYSHTSKKPRTNQIVNSSIKYSDLTNETYSIFPSLKSSNVDDGVLVYSKR